MDAEVKLKIADNGVIKQITMQQVNGTDHTEESIIAYDFNDIDSKVQFFNDLCHDLGIEVKQNKHKLNITKEIDPNSNLTQEELKQLIDELDYAKQQLETKLTD